MSQDNTSIPEGQIFLKSESLGQKMPASHTPILTPARQVEMEIRQAVHKGIHELEFDLNPLDLGKMNVRLNIDAEGQVKALIQAEKIETYELLQKDTTTRDIILKAFEEAGLMADGNSLHFSHQESNARNQSTEDFLMLSQYDSKQENLEDENLNLIYQSRLDSSRAYDIFA
ncbi:MAG: flagellar hook-length control protein FliK [Janthinobacterium lividum]